jgi:hypothetical protein
MPMKICSLYVLENGLKTMDNLFLQQLFTLICGCKWNGKWRINPKKLFFWRLFSIYILS